MTVPGSSILRAPAIAPRVALTTVLAFAFVAPGSAGAAAIGEQIDRATGAAGSSALADVGTRPKAISEDGRYAFFDYVAQSGAKHGAVSSGVKPVLGAYRRDIVDNTTVQLAVGGYDVQSTSDGAKASFVTNSRLLPADTDSKLDVYVIDVATKALTLVSNSTADARGRITRDGTAAVWTAERTYRTVLATGARTELGRGLYNIDGASADGRVVAGRIDNTYESTPTTFLREGKPALTFDGSGGPSLNHLYYVAISPDGKIAALTGVSATRVVAIDVASGGSEEFTWSADPTSRTEKSFNVSNEGWLQVSADGTAPGIHEVNLRTKELRRVSTDSIKWSPWVLSNNGRFALTAAGGASHGFAVATGSTPLPGTIDPPSPFVYLSYTYGCTKDYLYAEPQSTAITAPSYYANEQPVPAPASAAVKVRDRSTGLVANQFTITQFDRPYPLRSQSGNIIVDATVKLADGRSVSGSYLQYSYGRPGCYFG